jgi:hypothetical protein
MTLFGCDEVRQGIYRLDDHEYGAAFGLAFSGIAWTHYHVAVVIIAVRRQGPLPFGAFLDWAAQAAMLRVPGVAYQFRHLQLQDWPTSPGPEPSNCAPRRDSRRGNVPPDREYQPTAHN